MTQTINEQQKIISRLYEEARKEIPSLERKLLWRDVDNEIRDSHGGGQKSYSEDYKPIGLTENSRVSREYLRSKGFSKVNPSIEEFLEKNGLEEEISTFVKTYTEALLDRENQKRIKAEKEARERGIRDAESSARYHNRNRNYKESWEGDD